MCRASKSLTQSRVEQNVSVSEKCVHVFKQVSFYSHSINIMFIVTFVFLLRLLFLRRFCFDVFHLTNRLFHDFAI